MRRAVTVCAALASAALALGGGSARAEHAAAGAAGKPHIVHVVVDDWGWGEAGYHLPAGSAAAGAPSPHSTPLPPSLRGLCHQKMPPPLQLPRPAPRPESQLRARTAEVRTPNIDALVAEGLELDRYYTCAFCPLVLIPVPCTHTP